MQTLQNIQLNQNNQFMTIPKVQSIEIIDVPIPKQPEKKWQDTPFFEYFVSKLNNKQKLIDVQEKYNKNLQQKLQNQIQEGTIKVSKKKRFNLTVKKQQTEEEKFHRERQELENKKKIFKQSLSKVFEQQQNLLHKNASILRNSRQRSQSHFEQVNPHWKQEVALSLKKLKQFQGTIKQKDKIIQERINSSRLHDIENKMKFIEQIKQRNRNQILEKHEKYKSLKEQELNERKKCQLLVKKMKPETYKFQQVEQIRREQLQKIQSERSFQQQTLRKQRTTLNRKDLQAHEQAYFQIINERKQRWITQFQSFKATKRSQVRHYSGMFLQKVIEEQNRIKEEVEEKQQQKIEAIHKAKQYSQYVKECFKPKILTPFNPQKQDRDKNHLSLTRIQQRIKGIENLNYVKEKINSIKNDPQKHKTVEKTTSLPRLNAKTVYKDYLKQQPSRVKRQLSTKEGFEAALTERKSDWLQNACTYIQKLQKKENTKKGKPLIQTAFRKLQLLNALY